MTFRSSKARWPGLTREPRLREHAQGGEKSEGSGVGGGAGKARGHPRAIKDHRRLEQMITLSRDAR